MSRRPTFVGHLVEPDAALMEVRNGFNRAHTRVALWQPSECPAKGHDFIPRRFAVPTWVA